MSSVSPPQITNVLDRLRGRIRRYVLWEGLALVVVVLGLIFWGSFLVDWAYFSLSNLELPREFRALFLIAALGCVAAGVLIWIVFRLVRSLRSRALALVLERRFPQLDDRLITAVEASEGAQSTSGDLGSPMLAHTIRDAAQLAEKLDLAAVFDWRPLRRAVVLATMLVVSILGLMVFDSQAMDRWVHGFLGLSDNYWPRETELRVQVLLQPGDRVRDFENYKYRHPRGADLTLMVLAADGTVWPERVKLTYRMKNGRGSGQPFLNRTGDQPFLHTIAGLLDDVDIWVSGNDYANARPYKIEVVEPPHVDMVELDALFPAYMGLNPIGANGPERTPLPVQGVQISVPMETDFLLRVQANKPLRAMRLEGESQGERFEVEFGRKSADGSAATQSAGFVTLKSQDGKPQLQIPWPADMLPEIWSADQRTASIPFALPQAEMPQLSEQLQAAVESGVLKLPLIFPPDAMIRIHLEDADGISSTEPGRLTINGIIDEPPRIESELKGIGTSITRKARIPLAGVVTDDYGVAQARFEFQVDATPWQPREFTQPVAGVKEYRLARDENEPFERFDVLPLDLSIRQKLLLTVWAQDGDDRNGPHESRGQKFEFTIVPVEELLSILFAKELNLRKRFEQIITEIKQTKADLELHRDKQARVLELQSQPATDKTAEELTTLRQAIAACAERNLHGLRKNATETAAIESSFRDIREELVNNAAETVQMLDRLDLKIIGPLAQINATDYPNVDGILGIFRLANEQGTDPTKSIAESITETELLVEHLEQVLLEIQELEQFHKLLENLKQMITDQQDLIEKTKIQRKQNAIKALE